jgi:uncharacterized membrane protein
MNQTSKKLSKTVLTGMLLASTVAPLTSSHASKPTKLKLEKCYGITKKGHNDCGTSAHSCSNKATKDNDSKEWIYTLKGNCSRILGGKTKPE